MDASTPTVSSSSLKLDASLASLGSAPMDIETQDTAADELKDSEDHITPAKRKYEEGPGTDSPPPEDEVVVVAPVEDDENDTGPKPLKVNPDGTVEQEDTVK